MTQYLLILILTIVIVLLFVYNNYFYYTVMDSNGFLDPVIKHNNIVDENIIQIKTNLPEQNNEFNNTYNYLKQKKYIENLSESLCAHKCDDLLNKYIKLNSNSNNISDEQNKSNNTDGVDNEQNKSSNQYIDKLMEINHLELDFTQESNKHCTNPNTNILNKYLNTNNIVLEKNLENFVDVKFDNDYIDSSNIINSITETDFDPDTNLDPDTNPDPNQNFYQTETFLSNNNNKTNKLNKTNKTNKKNPRYIWVYWENINQNKYPTYIKLCMDGMKKHLGLKYNLIFLNEKTIKYYLPDLRDDFVNLKIAQKVDYYRVALLYKYGGIWIDADIIVMKDFDPIFQKLDMGYDYVGFGCTGNKCSNGYFKPSNWVMGSCPEGILMKKCLDKLNVKLDQRNPTVEQNILTYHDYGKNILWDSLDELKTQNYDYYHFTSEYDGARDANKEWINVNNFFSLYPTKFLNESKLLFVVLYNSEIIKEPKYKWVYDCDESKLLYGNEWICSLFRKSLNIV